MADRNSREGVHLAVQSVLYKTPLATVERVLTALAQATERLQEQLPEQLPGASVTVHLGDCSPEPALAPDELDALRSLAPVIDLHYHHFEANLGHGEAQNRLTQDHDADLMLMMNPDVVVAPDVLARLAAVVVDDETVGIVDGKQLPLEHPKRFDPVTGETSWCSGALSLVRGRAFREVGGFDSSAFYMHGDDVDLSWRLRLNGWKAVHHPGAVGFHDRRLSAEATMLPSPLEHRSSAEASLTLAYLWGATERLAQLRRQYQASPDVALRQALAAFDARRGSGALRSPEPRAAEVASFDGDTYGGHRW